MNDWREDLQQDKPTKYERKEFRIPANPNPPNLCSCMAAMKGKWIDGVYICVRCTKRVYDAFS